MPDGSVLSGKGTVVAEPICSDCGIKTTMKADLDGMGAYEEHDLWGYDSNTGKLHFYSITSSGAVHDHQGSWRNERTMKFRWKGLSEGKTTIEDVVIEFASPNEIHVHETNTIEGKPGPLFDYFLKRQ